MPGAFARSRGPHCLEAGQVLAVLQEMPPALSAPEAVAAVVPGIAQNHHGLFPQGLGLPQGMAHQGAGQSFSLKGGEDGQGTEGDGVQIPACLQLDGAGGAGDLPGQDAVRLAYEGQLRAEGGGLTEQMEIVVLVAAGLVDVPKGSRTSVSAARRSAGASWRRVSDIVNTSSSRFCSYTRKHERNGIIVICFSGCLARAQNS